MLSLPFIAVAQETIKERREAASNEERHVYAQLLSIAQRRKMQTERSRAVWLLAFGFLTSLGFARAPMGDQYQSSVKVGQQADNSYFVATGQRISPAGKQVEFFGRPVDLALSPSRNLLAVKNSHGLVFINTLNNQVTQILD